MSKLQKVIAQTKKHTWDTMSYLHKIFKPNGHFSTNKIFSVIGL